jgi:glyoxylase-like metal-dependent hydrolase (beta-lactamase superfamily II)
MRPMRDEKPLSAVRADGTNGRNRRHGRVRMAKQFASQADLTPKQVTFTELAPGAYAYTAEGDPNTGIVVGDDCVLVVDTQATPIMAQDVINRIRGVTDKPIKHIVLSHYHAVRVLGRFPRLFEGVDSVPGLTWPNIVIDGKLTLFLGSVEVQIWHPGRGHTKGDTIVWLPKHKVLYSGDLVEFGATPYTGDAYHEDWPATLDKLLELKPEKLVPGRGDALTNAAKSRDAIEGTRAFLADMYGSVKRGRAAGKSLSACYKETYEKLAPKYGRWVIFDHCLPFDVTRCYDEAGDYRDPRIWTAERDDQMWHSLQNEIA